jgi:uncharacterized protein YkwD
MVNRNATLALLGLAALLFSACSGGGGLLGPTTPSGVSVDSVEFASFSLVNDERLATKSGGKLAKEATVARLAREYSEEMMRGGFFAHTSPDGRDLKARLQEAGIEFSSAGENLAKVTNASDPASYAHTLLMQHEEHRRNILDSKYEFLGIGAAREGDTVWITQVFIRN